MASTQVEVKVWGSVIGSALAGAAIAVLNAVQTDPNLLGNLPTWLQTVVLLVVPALITFIGGYVKRSNTSSVSS